MGRREKTYITLLPPIPSNGAPANPARLVNTVADLSLSLVLPRLFTSHPSRRAGRGEDKRHAGPRPPEALPQHLRG